MTKVLLIDNYDSFTYNLVHYLQDVSPDVEVEVVRNDALTAKEALAKGADAIVLSPGPCTPDDAGICLELIKLADDTMPILGVCLGHQAIGQAMGGIVEGAKDIVHGKAWDVKVLGGDLFAGVPEKFQAVRYHSLAIRRDGMPNVLSVDAETADGEVMAVSHATRPVYGVQFHPESIGSQYGKVMLANFLKKAGLK
ncbi:MAG TPA: aminodeoxychorismate/anthranilate synthase component II [Hyphomonadaceae bacterium]|nr:aminodeoxychorismate/anthranilate synthase component II [Hyphomonadaceae bacterium]HPN07263.1 aminodeoxychorismate/anthranilate synthase component II [Hyphomonadaceae bacterium]